nr:hypothetical protein [Bacteroides sp.]
MIALIYIGIAAAIAAAVLTFFSWRWSAGVAAAGYLAAYLGATFRPELFTLLFWLATAVLVMVLNITLPRHIATSRTGLGYIAGGSLTGLFAGYLIAPSWIVLGAVIGTVLGAIAYSFTPAGRQLEFPSGKFVQYLCAKGLPAVVTLALSALTILLAVTTLTFAR